MVDLSKKTLKRITKAKWKKIEKLWYKNFPKDIWTTIKESCWIDGNRGVREIFVLNNKTPMLVIDVANNRSKSRVYLVLD